MNRVSPSKQSPPYSVEKLFQLLQKNLSLWSTPTGLQQVFPQATHFAQQLVAAYQDNPSKLTAQLHQDKSHYPPTTNLIAKASIFSCICSDELGHNHHNQASIVAATVTANIAALNPLTHKANGQTLTPKQRAIIQRSRLLSYKLLQKHQVIDELWLHCLKHSFASAHRDHYPLGCEGTLVTIAYQFSEAALNQASMGKMTILTIIRHIYLNSKLPFSDFVCELAVKRLHRCDEGSIVTLKNHNIAQLMLSVPSINQDPHPSGLNRTQQDDQLNADSKLHQPLSSPSTKTFIAYECIDYPNSYKGRLRLITESEIDSIQGPFHCNHPHFYSRIWETPLQDFLQQHNWKIPKKAIHVSQLTPPDELISLVAMRFEHPDLNKLLSVVTTPTVNRLLTKIATDMTKAKIPIKSAKHALAMLGLNQIGSILYRGLVAEQLAKVRFAGQKLVDNRLACLFASLKFFNNQFNDSLHTETLLMYVQFYLAPWQLNPKLQHTAIHLFQCHQINAHQAFNLGTLLGMPEITSQQHHQHQQACKQLFNQWNLPKFANDLVQQLHLSSINHQLPQPLAITLAVIKLSIYNCHCIFNSVSLDEALLNQQLQTYNQLLKLDNHAFQRIQQQFIADYSPMTPLFLL